MALSFYYGTMGSGKTTAALQKIYDIQQTKNKLDIWSGRQRTPGKLESRMGFSIPCQEFNNKTTFLKHPNTDIIVIDEAQFLTETQVDQLIQISLQGTEIIAFGLLAAYNGTIFPASTRLLVFSDTKKELPIIPACHCGNPATVPARYTNGIMDTDGELIQIGDLHTPDSNEPVDVQYKSLCTQHYFQEKAKKELT